MGFFSHDSEEAYAHQQVTSGHHQASWTHELIAGAASFEAAKAFEDYQRRNGKVVNHAQAKELLAGFAGAFIDREVETKGLDYIDSHKAKREASANAERALEQHQFSGGEYGGGEHGRGEYREGGYGREEREYGERREEYGERREEYGEEHRHHGHEHEHHGHGHEEHRHERREWD